MKKFSDFAKSETVMSGDKIRISEVVGKEIVILGYRISDSKFNDKNLLTLQIELNGEERVVFTSGTVLIEQVEKYKEHMPFLTTIQKVNDRFYTFT